MPGDDDLTRNRLLEAAGEVFAARGFQSATVREICTRAGTNIAAVNYYFGDKMGLYLATFRRSVCEAQADDLPESALQNGDPEQLLRVTIARMLQRMYGATEKRAWHFQIMAHEMAHPTEALPRVADEIIGPKYLAMRRVISRIVGLPPDDDTVRFCAHSVIGQVIHYAHARPVIACVWPALNTSAEGLEAIAAHIADFSICSLREIARKKKESYE